ncbi:HalOD1 output domain-containing protein [Halobaculum marinum]|nr:HalOD1 output domain-containing protein [Halobaculum sp. DT55]
MTAAANRSDTDEAELPPLYEYVDMDAVRSIVTHASGGGGASTRVEFSYADCRVVVDGDGAVTVDPDDESPVDPDDDGSNPKISG